MAAPKQFGRYKVLELLGSGAMGEVYKCEDTKVFNRIVAVKVLLEKLATNETSVARFENEVKAAATLDHPNIVAIFDRGHDEGRPYFVMEYLEGIELQALTAGKEQRPADFLVDLGSQITDALDYAHERGIIHRDVKPSNIFVVRRGTEEHAKLLDFGIVHLEGSDLTHTTEQPGTHVYMAPEVMRGNESDRRSDLFSLGIVLYELFTQEHPFQAPTVPMILQRVLDESPPKRPRKINTDLPVSLESIILKLLEKDPDQRPQRAKTVVEYLREIARDLRFSGSTGTPSGLSADDVTMQTVRVLKQRARQFEADAQLEEALKLREKALALLPEDARQKSKVETLRHDIERNKKVDNQLKMASQRLDAGNVPGAREAWNDAWLVGPNDARVIEFRGSLEQAEENFSGPSEVSELHPAVEQARSLYREGKASEARRILIDHIRSEPGDQAATKLLDDIVAGRDLDPPAIVEWSGTDRERLRKLEQELAAVSSAADACGPEFREKLNSLHGKWTELSDGPAAPRKIDGLHDEVKQSSLEVGRALRKLAQDKAESLERLSNATKGVLATSDLSRAGQAVDGLRRLDDERTLQSGPGAVREASESRRRIETAVSAAIVGMRRELDSYGEPVTPQMEARLDAWSRFESDEPLTALVDDIRRIGGARGAAIAAEIRDWANRVDGSGSLDDSLIRRFRQIADEIEGDLSGGGVERLRVGADAIAALRDAHARSLESLEEQKRSLATRFEEMGDWILVENRSTVDSLCSSPLPAKLGDARQVVEALGRHLADAEGLRAKREEQARQGLEALILEAREVTKDPWLERSVKSSDEPTPATQKLVQAAMSASDAGGLLQRAVATAAEESMPVARRVEHLAGALEQARAAAGTSREAHEKALQEWEACRGEITEQVESWREAGLPDQLRSRASRVLVPAAVGESSGADSRSFVQGMSLASATVADLRERITRLEPDLRNEAEALIDDIRKVGGGFRFPRVASAVRGDLEARSRELADATRESQLDLVALMRMVEQTRETLGRVPRNRAPLIVGAMLLLVTGLAGWLVLAPRTVTLRPGLGADDVWITRAGTTEAIQGVKQEDGSWKFRLPRGSYEIEYGSGPARSKLPEPVSLGLASLPVPFSAEPIRVGADPQDEVFKVLKEEFGDLFQ